MKSSFDEVDEDKSILKSQTNFPKASGGSTASIDELDSYLECMYDSVLEKVAATGKIAELAGRTEDLEALLMHEPQIGALMKGALTLTICSVH